MSSEEQVVLLDDTGLPIGVMSKQSVHTDQTPLHLAFSCYLFNDRGEVLVTRRALGKRTWPGVWTNSFCGHPSPEEAFVDAIARRGRQELGAEVVAIQSLIPDFRYRATDASGIVENEICPVYSARLVGELKPHPAEVAEYAWVQPAGLAGAIERAPFAFSPWLVVQVSQLALHPSQGFAWR